MLETEIDNEPVHPGRTSSFVVDATSPLGESTIVYGLAHESGEGLLAAVTWFLIASTDPNYAMGLTYHLAEVMVDEDTLNALKSFSSNIPDEVLRTPTVKDKLCSHVSLRPGKDFSGHMFFAEFDTVADIAALQFALANPEVLLQTVESLISDAERIGVPIEAINAAKFLFELRKDAGSGSTQIVEDAINELVDNMEEGIAILSEVYSGSKGTTDPAPKKPQSETVNLDDLDWD